MKVMNDTIVIIPARSGSKGLPGKNIKLLNGIPLIQYTIQAAIEVALKENICLSTDDEEIASVAKTMDINVPFLRPSNLATDAANTWDVVRHALEWYKNERQMVFSKVALLQPTSPLRNGKHILESYNLLDANIEMVVSVKETKGNPYFTLFEENIDGTIIPSKVSNFTRRQDCPKVYELNGAIYLFKVTILNRKLPLQSSIIKKYLMSDRDSIDIDNIDDFELVRKIMDSDGISKL